MSRLACVCVLFVIACRGTTTHSHVAMRVGGREVEASTLLVLPGTRLTFAGISETTDQGVFPTTSDSEHSEYASAELDIRCKSRTTASCAVEGNTITPERAGTFDVTVVADGDHDHPRYWTITALDVKRVELEPCDTIAASPGERHVGVYAVGPEGRLKLAMPAVIDGVPGTSVSISQPATFELRASVAGISGACRLVVVAAP